MQMHTHVAEFGIACEACHGPGAEHIAFHKSMARDQEVDPIVNPAKLTHERSTEVCGQCHLVSCELRAANSMAFLIHDGK